MVQKTAVDGLLTALLNLLGNSEEAKADLLIGSRNIVKLKQIASEEAKIMTEDERDTLVLAFGDKLFKALGV